MNGDGPTGGGSYKTCFKPLSGLRIRLSQELSDSHQQAAIIDRLFKKSPGPSVTRALFMSKPVTSGHDNDRDAGKFGKRTQPLHDRITVITG
jgi:hypothetical protein